MTLIGVLVVQKCVRDEATERLRLSHSEHWFMIIPMRIRCPQGPPLVEPPSEAGL